MTGSTAQNNPTLKPSPFNSKTTSLYKAPAISMYVLLELYGKSLVIIGNYYCIAISNTATRRILEQVYGVCQCQKCEVLQASPLES